MVNLLEKVVNCYKYYLTRLTYGITNQDYGLLYGAVLLLKNNITDDKYVEFFSNNLSCAGDIVLSETETTTDLLSWTLNASPVLLDSFVFYSSQVPTIGTYSITTTVTSGYNFLYITVPGDKAIQIYDSLSDLVYDSEIAGSYEFAYVGDLLMSNNKTNSVLRKLNVFNTYNPVTYYIKIY